MYHRPGDLSVARRSRDERDGGLLFGMRISDLDAGQCADLMLTVRRTAGEGVGLFVTPNIQHIARMRTDPPFAAAMQGAQLIVCDGFPVFRYAALRGHVLPGRVTGREVIDRMLAQPGRLAGHRLFFVVDSDQTVQALAAWMAANASSVAFETVVPPLGFGADAAASAALADRIRAFGATLLFMGIGAPRSEVFVDRHRAQLPPCWALCVGQSFKISLGLTVRPPALMVRLNLEWLWRILLEPRRMLRRYGPSGIGFLRAVADDLRHGVTRS